MTEANGSPKKLSKMAQMVLHDLRDALTPIRISADLLRRTDASQPGDLADIAKLISAQVERCLELIASCNQESEPKLEALELQSWLTAELKLREQQNLAAQILVVLEPSPQEFWCLANPLALNRVLANLLSNAEKVLCQMPLDRRLIRLALFADNQEVGFRLKDNGPGIPQAIAANLFDAFVTTSTDGSGQGLGLNICRELMRSMNGEIELLPLDQGTEFRLTLQGLTRPHPKQEPSATSSNQAQTDPSCQTVLIVDDDRATRHSYQRLLTLDGYRVLTAADGQSALTLLTQERADFILVDCHLPDILGPELFAKIVAQNPEHKSAIIFTTGETQDQNLIEAMNATGALLLFKPFGEADLQQAFAIQQDRR